MALKQRLRPVGVIVLAAASACMIAGCESDGVHGSAQVPPQDKPLVEAALTNGTYLDCTQWETGDQGFARDFVLDCDWDHVRTTHNPDLQAAGTFQVVQMRLKDGRTLNCLNFDSDGNTVPDCDWNHPVKTG